MNIKMLMNDLNKKGIFGNHIIGLSIMEKVFEKEADILKGAKYQEYTPKIMHPNFKQRLLKNDGTKDEINLTETKVIQDFIINKFLQNFATKKPDKHNVKPQNTVVYLAGLLQAALDTAKSYMILKYVSSLISNLNFTAFLEFVINSLYTQRMFSKMNKSVVALYLGTKVLDNIRARVKETQKLPTILATFGCKNYDNFLKKPNRELLSRRVVISRRFYATINKGTYVKDENKYLTQLLFVILNNKYKPKAMPEIQKNIQEIQQIYQSVAKIIGYEILTLLIENKIVSTINEIKESNNKNIKKKNLYGLIASIHKS